jgi:hypothetical protein
LQKRCRCQFDQSAAIFKSVICPSQADQAICVRIAIPTIRRPTTAAGTAEGQFDIFSWTAEALFSQFSSLFLRGLIRA